MRKSLSLICFVTAIILCFTSCGLSSASEEVTYILTGGTQATVSQNNTISSQPPADGPADSSWFNDAVFIGDSITVKLSYYSDATGDLGNAQFICAASLGWGNAQWDLFDENAVHPSYNGDIILTQDAIYYSGANKAIIGLGMNDIGNYGVDGAIHQADKLLAVMVSRTPDVDIYVESVTPMLEEVQTDSLNNELVREFNEKLEDVAYSHCCKFINTYDSIADENGNLPYDFCSDPDAQGIHFTDEACAIWVDCLKENVV